MRKIIRDAFRVLPFFFFFRSSPVGSLNGKRKKVLHVRAWIFLRLNVYVKEKKKKKKREKNVERKEMKEKKELKKFDRNERERIVFTDGEKSLRSM